MPGVERRTEEEKQKEGREARDDRGKLGGIAESVAIVPKLFGPANSKRGLHDAFCGPAKSQQTKSQNQNQEIRLQVWAIKSEPCQLVFQLASLRAKAKSLQGGTARGERERFRTRPQRERRYQ